MVSCPMLKLNRSPAAVAEHPSELREYPEVEQAIHPVDSRGLAAPGTVPLPMAITLRPVT